jgi:hypothetical protein
MDNKINTLPEHLFEVYRWISQAGEWDEASKNPEKYAHDAFLNAVENEQFYVLEEDLKEVIAWHIKN